MLESHLYVNAALAIKGTSKEKLCQEFSRSQMFFRIGVMKSSAIFTGKHLCWSPFLINLRAYNLGQNICRLFHFSAQFVFTTSETELDHYHQAVNVELPHELRNDLRLRILGNYEVSRKSLKCLDLSVSNQPSSQKSNFDVFLFLIPKNQLRNIL